MCDLLDEYQSNYVATRQFGLVSSNGRAWETAFTNAAINAVHTTTLSRQRTGSIVGAEIKLWRELTKSFGAQRLQVLQVWCVNRRLVTALRDTRHRQLNRDVVLLYCIHSSHINVIHGYVSYAYANCEFINKLITHDTNAIYSHALKTYGPKFGPQTLQRHISLAVTAILI